MVALIEQHSDCRAKMYSAAGAAGLNANALLLPRTISQYVKGRLQQFDFLGIDRSHSSFRGQSLVEMEKGLRW